MNIPIAIFFACAFATMCTKKPNYVKASDEVTKVFVQKMHDNEELSVLGQGAIFEEKKIAMLYADFTLNRECSEPEAKKLLERVKDELIFQANNTSSLKEHAKTYPITSKEISLTIAFLDERKRPSMLLGQIDFHGERVTYSKYDSLSQSYIPYKKE